MGKKSKRVRNKQTKEENEKARNIAMLNYVSSRILGLNHINKKTQKKMVGGKKGYVYITEESRDLTNVMASSV